MGYPEAVTIGRKFEFLTASPESLQTIGNDRALWKAADHNPDDYPGILAMPGDATVLADFDVPPGVFAGATAPC